ncbi:MAG: hypothetical protein IPM54_08060 [Polyangiaceae bacterium]|nr:hypothetical protein [Polyangiaceae bacterium]
MTKLRLGCDAYRVKTACSSAERVFLCARLETTMDVADPIPPSVKALVELFKNELAAVAFPGVDGAMLEQLIGDVQKYTDAVIQAEAAVEAARTALRESEEALAVKSQKALAYARVYAADNPEIAAKVDFVSRIAGASAAPPTGSTRDRDGGSDAPPKRRGRPKAKAAAADATDATPAPAAVEAVDATPAAPAVMELPAGDVDASAMDAPAMDAAVN